MKNQIRNFLSHHMNPLHVYCSLMAMGMNCGHSKMICKLLQSIIMTKSNGMATYRI